MFDFLVAVFIIVAVVLWPETGDGVTQQIAGARAGFVRRFKLVEIGCHFLHALPRSAQLRFLNTELGHSCVTATADQYPSVIVGRSAVSSTGNFFSNLSHGSR